jgi:hypothetical protein
MSQPASVELGEFRLLSGNTVSVTFDGERGDIGYLRCAWDRLPLNVMDELEWAGRIVPALNRLVAEFQERPVPASLLLVMR